MAVVGLNFGEQFLPIYLRHPRVAHVAIVEPDEERRRSVGDRYGIEDRFESLEQALNDKRIDAVHILSPVANHARQSIAVLSSGRHCACAVPMATGIPDLQAVIAAERSSAKNYMMMETSVYGREFLAVRDLYRKGSLGRITFYRGFHIQNLDGFPRYWLGYPPMAYITHALSPLLALLDTGVESVTCAGSGRLTPDRVGDYDNRFPLEVGLFRLQGSEVIADVTMSFFQTARSFLEGFSVYGDAMGVEWPEHEGGPLSTFELLPLEEGSRGRKCRERTFEPPDWTELLPPEVSAFARDSELRLRPGSEPVLVKAWHSGSHPYLAHEFVSSIVEGRKPAVDAVTAARWTAPGIHAHESAMDDGKQTAVTRFG